MGIPTKQDPGGGKLGEANNFAPTGTRHVMHPECYELRGTSCKSPSKAPEGRGSSLAYLSGPAASVPACSGIPVGI